MSLKENFKNLSLEDLVKELKSKFAVEFLKGTVNFPFELGLNIEFIGNKLKTDFQNRPQDYLKNLFLFVDVDLDYIYYLLSAIREYFKNQNNISDKDLENLFKFFDMLKEKGLFEKEVEKDLLVWLANGRSISLGVVEILKDLLQKNGFNFKKYRKEIFDLIKYFLKYPDPKTKDEELETAKIKQEKPEEKVADPFNLAINSVRGRAFEVFVNFVVLDGNKLKDDIKNVYKELISKEKTKAIRFILGYYLPWFYYRDREWFVKEILDKLFIDDKFLILATWEGYLTQNLYKDIFFEEKMQKLYKEALRFSKKDDPQRNFFTDPEKGLAVHLALAYLYFENFDFDSELLSEFLKYGNVNHHSEFVSFIGKYYILKEEDIPQIDNVNIQERLEKVWQFFIEKNNPEILSKFGFWLNPDLKIFDNERFIDFLYQTILKTNGKLDYSINLSKIALSYVDKYPEKIFEIVQKFLLSEINNHNFIFNLEEWKEVLKKLYKNNLTKQKTYQLINSLIQVGGQEFWMLKEII